MAARKFVRGPVMVLLKVKGNSRDESVTSGSVGGSSNDFLCARNCNTYKEISKNRTHISNHDGVK